MNLKLLTLAFDPELGGFPPDPLAEIEGEVVSAVEHFFHHAGIPHLLLIVHHHPHEEARTARTRGDGGLRAQLAEHERGLYDRLRAWRNGRANAEGVPPYVLLTNRQAADLARRRPASLSELQQVPGIGEAKARRLGSEILAVIARPQAQEDSSHAPA